ncbi:MAG TPA: amidase family protein, partial [Trueperaceae bacterium]
CIAPTTLFQEHLDPAVAEAFGRACSLLEDLGARVAQREVAVVSDIPNAYRTWGSFAGHESLALYGDMLERESARVDPRVSRRILEYKDRPASDYIHLMHTRERLREAFWEEVAGAAVVLAPTVPILPPRIDDLQADEAYFETNNRVLSHTMIFNFLGAPAVSVPCGVTPEGLSVGLMIAGRPHHEPLVLSVAAALERAVRA